MVLLVAAALGAAVARRLPLALTLPVALPLALGLQVLLRGGELLFAPQLSIRSLVALLVLPAAGAVATTVLARRHGPLALVAAGTALLLAPGWNVAATLGLVALAAGDVLAQADRGRIVKGLALLALLVPIAWDPLPGLATAAAALVLARPKEGPFVALAVAAGLAVFALRDPGWPSTAWLPFLLLPASLLPGRDRWLQALAALALALTVPRLPDISAMAAPLALLALGGGAPLPAGGRAVGEGSGVRSLWTAVLLGATGLLAAYPWLRADPLREALGLFGLAGTPLCALVAVAAAFILTGLGWIGLRRAPAFLAAGALFAAAWMQIPAAGKPLLPPASTVALDATHPSWTSPLAAQPVGTLVVESSLSNGAGLANGTPVATVHLTARDGRITSWPLLAGEDTGEWAARRPDVAAASVLVSPPAWISWVAGDFFGQRYRTRRTVDAPGPFTGVTIARHPALPPEVRLALHAVEVRK
ncbi:MAG TPA: hypothetical protein DD490_30440 [Acidobacteria bacterium]|nr:hypothetical protein [Acidobacteriota bacterium]